MGNVRRVFHAVLAAMLLVVFMGRDTHAYIRIAPPGWPHPVAPHALQLTPQHVFVFVMDGGLPSYLRLASFPHIAALVANGSRYTRAWDGMLETETPTGHASLGTGSLPRRHGVLSFSWVSDSNGLEHPTNPEPIHAGALEQVLRRSGVPSLASLLKKHDPSATVTVTSGHKDYAVDSVGGPFADYLMFYDFRGPTWTPVAIPRHVPPRSIFQTPGLTAFGPKMKPGDQDTLAINLAMSAFNRLHSRVTIVNLPEFDWPLGHLQGGNSNQWLAWRLMTNLDPDLGERGNPTCRSAPPEEDAVCANRRSWDAFTAALDPI